MPSVLVKLHTSAYQHSGPVAMRMDNEMITCFALLGVCPKLIQSAKLVIVHTELRLTGRGS
jgi:hypothetical protein